MSLSIDEICSRTVAVSWESAIEDASYTMNLLDGNGTTLVSVETQETSTIFKDLSTNTTYTIELFTHPPVSIDDLKFKKIRMQQSAHLVLSEIRVFDAGGVYMSADKFTFNSSSYSNKPPEIVMDGNIDEISTTQNIFLTGTDPVFWEATFAPTDLSSIEIYTHMFSSYSFRDDAVLILTTEDDQEVVLSLDGTEYAVDGHQKHQIVPLGPVGLPILSGIKIDTGNTNSSGSIMEVEPYDENGNILPRSDFIISSSSTHPWSDADAAMNGDNDGSWTAGILLDANSSGAFWNASFITPQKLSSLRIYSANDQALSPNTVLILTNNAGSEIEYSLGDDTHKVDTGNTGYTLYEIIF